MTTAEFWVSVATAAGAAGSLIIATLAFLHSKSVERRLTQDERLEFGPLLTVPLLIPDHGRAVLQCHVVNLGRRKAIITEVLAHHPRMGGLPVTWSTSLSAVGMPEAVTKLALVDQAITLFVRHDHGLQFLDGTTLTVVHSFPGSPASITFVDPWTQLK